MSKRRSCKTASELPGNQKSNQNSKYEVPSHEKEKPNTPLMLDDVTCKICMDIMVEPVTMPCGHEICFSCFENCVQKANLSCPMCRKRISVWVRHATKSNSLINQTLWKKIQATFPERIQARTNGEGVGPDDCVPTVPIHQLAEPGEILQEFEKERQRLLEEEEKRRRDEEMASARLIAELEAQQEAERARAAELERILKEDEALALMLSSPNVGPTQHQNQEIERTPISSTGRKRTRKSPAEGCSSSKRISNFFTSSQGRIQSTSTEPDTSSDVALLRSSRGDGETTDESGTSQSSVSDTNSSGADGRASGKQLHFRPSRATPRTPNNDLHDGQIVKSEGVNLLDKFQSVEEAFSNGDINQNLASTSSEDVMNGSLADELMAMERQWMSKKSQQEEADLELARELQRQLDEEDRRSSVVNRAKGSHDQYLLRSKSGSSGRKQQQVTIQDAFQKNSSVRRSTPGNFP